MSEWVRETLDRSLERAADEFVEFKIIRRLDVVERILLNVFADISTGVTITRDRVRQYHELLQ